MDCVKYLYTYTDTPDFELIDLNSKRKRQKSPPSCVCKNLRRTFPPNDTLVQK